MAPTVILLWLLYVFFMSIVNIHGFQIEPSSDFIRREQKQVGKHFNYIQTLTHLFYMIIVVIVHREYTKIRLIFLAIKKPLNRGI